MPPAGKLVAESLGKTYARAAAPALEGFSHRFAPGRITAVLGPSGSGKSTLLGLLAGLTRADAGRVLLDGADLTDRPAERRGFGVVFQQYALFPHLDVRENVEFPLRVRGVGRAGRRRQAEETLALARAGHLGNRRVHELSGGEQQRVALARALVFRPPVLLLDEPFSALDARLREELRADLAGLLAVVGVTTVFVTHDQAEAMGLGHELIVLRAGRIEQHGPPDELYRRPATPFVGAFLGSANVFDAEDDGRGTVHVPGLGPLAVGDLADGAGIIAAPGPCRVMLRPEEWELLAGNELATAAEAFPARVEARFFLGANVRLHLRAGAGGLPLLLDAPVHALPTAVGPGDVVRVRVRPGAGRVWGRAPRGMTNDEARRKLQTTSARFIPPLVVWSSLCHSSFVIRHSSFPPPAMSDRLLLTTPPVHPRPGLRRLAVLGGAYGNVPALRACLDRADALGCDARAFLGDVTGCCGHSDATVDLVRARFDFLVAGNLEQQAAADADTDCACNYPDAEDGRCSGLAHGYAMRSLSAENRRWLGTLPALAAVDADGGRLLLCHGSPRQTNEFLYESELDDKPLDGWLDAANAVGFVGTHSGLPWVRTLPGGRFAANCGVVGKPDDDGDPAVHFAVVERTSDPAAAPFAVRIERVEYDHRAWAAQLAAEGVDAMFTDPLLDGRWTVGRASLPPAERARRRP